MASFGSFETEREVYSDPGYTVYSARKQGDSHAEYALKVFRFSASDLEAELTGETASRDELEQARLRSIAIQETGAAASRFVAPIFEKGKNERGVWYATGFYPRSVNKMMSGKVALPRPSLEHLIRSVAQGALDLKRACGRSHGDIRPTNIQVSGSEKLTDAQVALSDPLAGGTNEGRQYETNDLRAIGLILLQLVRLRILTDEDVALMLPIGPSDEWVRTFGSDASDWLALCNRLLDPRLSPDHFKLEDLAARLDELKPKRRGSPGLAAAAAVVVVIVVALGLWLMRPRRGTSELSSKREPNPEQRQTAVVSDGASKVQKAEPAPAQPQPQPQPVTVVTAISPGTNPNPPLALPSNGALELKTQPVPGVIVDSDGRIVGHASADTPLILRLAPGPYSLAARADGLDAVAAILTVDPLRTNQHTFVFDYGTVDWTSEPVPASVSLGGETRVTPATFVQKPGAATSYIIVAPGYQALTNDVTVQSGERKTMVARLIPRMLSIELASDPPGAEFFAENGSPLGRSGTSSQSYYVPWGPANVVARYAALGAITNHLELKPDQSGARVQLKFDYGTLVLTNLPPDLAVYEGGTRIGSAADNVVYQKQGSHLYALRGQSGSESIQTNINAGLNYLCVVTAEKSWKNSLGMWFAWVPNLPGGGPWPGQSEPGGWVALTEVTQGQYKKMDGSNPSIYHEGDNYPVENLTCEQALSYCRWLASADTAARLGWQYNLPTDEQFCAFAGNADHIARVTNEGRMTSTADDLFPLQRTPRIPAAANLGNSARSHPEPVGSTKQPNQFGLYDVIGNVWEWLARSNGRDNYYAGGSYLNFSAKTLAVKARERALEKGPAIGFRVILVPSQ